MITNDVSHGGLNHHDGVVMMMRTEKNHLTT